MSNKEVELLKIQLEKLSEDKFDLSSWKSSTSIILSRIFGDNYQGIKAIEKIRYDSAGVYGGGSGLSWNNMESCIKQGKEILVACISELETFGPPEKKDPSSGINISLTQNQSVNIHLLISALEDELTGIQLKEVKEIMNSKEPTEQKKNKILNKIKGFGGDIASNILANILTNPNIWR